MVFGSTLSQRFGSDRRRTNGVRVEHFPRILYIGNSRWDSKDVNQSESKNIIFMSMYNDIVWRERGNKEHCIANCVKITEQARKFPEGRWSFLGLGSEKKWYGTHTHKQDGGWDKTSESMMLNFAESWHPVFRATNALERGEKKEVYSLQRWWWYCWIDSSHCCFCQSAQYFRSSRRLVWIMSQSFTKCWKPSRKWDSGINGGTGGTSNCEQTWMYRWTCCENASKKPQNFLNTRNWPNCAPTLTSWRIVENDNSSLHLRKKVLVICVENTHYLGKTKIGLVSDGKVYFHQGRYCVDIMIESLFRDRTVSWVRIVNGINKYVTETWEEISIECEG